MTHDQAEKLAETLAIHLVSIYFESVDREKLSTEEMLHECPKFMQDIWEIMINKAFRIIKILRIIIKEEEKEMSND